MKNEITKVESGAVPLSIRKELLKVPVLVAALGYMVDMYDLFLFSIIRIPSLKSLNVPEESIIENGVLLLNLQMIGLLLGGIFWGIMGDKKGRLSVLFGSILIYSLANIANGFVTSITWYAVLRFVAGFGLAGELGAGITLVTEILPARIRGYGATLIATLGVLGALLAYWIVLLFDWRASFIIGGILGLLLLFMRVKIFESATFANLKKKNIKRGDIRMLFNSKARIVKYLTIILVGVPIWFVIGIIVTFSPELGKAMGVNDPVDAGKAVLFAFAGQVAGNIVSGVWSQHIKSRKRVILLFICGSFLFVMLFLIAPFKNLTTLYTLCVCLGFFSGYWTIFITVSAELFGSNIRATVATTVPNFVRGMIVPMTMLFLFFRQHTGIVIGALIVAFLAYGIALLALFFLEETFDKEINRIEE